MDHRVEKTSETDQRLARFGDFEADLATGRLTSAGVPVPIQRQPFEALRLLLLANGDMVRREVFHQTLWPAAVHVDFERGLTSAMRKVREALQDSGRTSRFVETLPGRGYRFRCPIEFVSGAVSEPRMPRRNTWRLSAASALIVGMVLGGTTGRTPSVAGRDPRTVVAARETAAAYTALACVRKQQGRHAEAAALADAALALAPDDALTVALAGFYAHPVGRYDREKELIDRAARMDPTSTEVLWHLALSQARRADYDASLATFDRALTLSPDSPQLLYWRGFVEAESGRLADADRTLTALARVAEGRATGDQAVASLRWIIQNKSNGPA